MLLSNGNSNFILIILSLFTICGCAAANHKQPSHFTGNHFDIGSSVEIITLLPVINNRNGRSDAEDYSKLTKDIETELLFKGYEVEIATDFEQTMEINFEDIRNMQSRDLAKLGPSHSEYLFIFSLIDSKYTNAVVVTSSTIESKGCLIDKKKGRIIWEGGCSESVTSGFGIGHTLVTPVKGLSMRKCFLNMFSEFPHKAE